MTGTVLIGEQGWGRIQPPDDTFQSAIPVPDLELMLVPDGEDERTCRARGRPAQTSARTP
jgi:hypothetical protein